MQDYNAKTLTLSQPGHNDVTVTGFFYNISDTDRILKALKAALTACASSINLEENIIVERIKKTYLIHSSAIFSSKFAREVFSQFGYSVGEAVDGEKTIKFVIIVSHNNIAKVISYTNKLIDSYNERNRLIDSYNENLKTSNSVEEIQVPIAKIKSEHLVGEKVITEDDRLKFVVASATTMNIITSMGSDKIAVFVDTKNCDININFGSEQTAAKFIDMFSQFSISNNISITKNQDVVKLSCI